MHENKWKLLCENKSDFEFDAVILTIPVPQVLQIEGIISYIQGLIYLYCICFCFR